MIEINENPKLSNPEETGEKWLFEMNEKKFMETADNKKRNKRKENENND